MKKLLVLILSCASFYAMADENVNNNQWWSSSSSQYQQTNPNYNNHVPSFYLNLNTGVGNSDLSNLMSSSALNFGYMFNYYFGLEIGYNYFVSTQGVEGNTSTAQTSIGDIAIKGVLPLSDWLNLYGRLGVGYGSNNWTNVENKYSSSQDLGSGLVGVGISYVIVPSLELHLEDYNYIPFNMANMNGSSLNTVALGLQYNF